MRGGVKGLLWVVILAIGGAGAVAGGLWLRARVGFPERAPLPTLPDVAESGWTGVIQRKVGTIYVRPSRESDFKNPKFATLPPEADAAGWETLNDPEELKMGSLVHVPSDSSLQFETTGRWVVLLDGPGEFIFEQARRSDRPQVHTVQWFVRSGRIRARPDEFASGEHWLEMRTEIARVVVRDGELGAQVSEGGRGQAWLMTGEARVTWKDGRKKALPLKGMEFL